MKKLTFDRLTFNIISYTFTCIFSLVCIIPFIMVISGSLSNEKQLIVDGYSLLPRGFSTEAYRFIFNYPQKMIRAFEVTLFVTLFGTLFSLFLMSMAAYVMQRKDFKWRNGLSFFFFFTTLFNGGVVPWYILMVKYFHMKDNIMVLIIPYLFNVFYMIILKTFMSSIPDAITESAKIDGAGDFRIFIQLIVPLSKPAFATIGLFMALIYWNDWWQSLMFMNKEEYFSLQYYLYKLLASIEGLRMAMQQPGVRVPDFPQESLKSAMTVVATGPIILLYPYIQKYFVKGITIGAVKG